MLCPSCRQEASGSQCDFCGTTLAESSAGYAGRPSSGTAAGRLSPDTAAAVSYLTVIPSILFLLMDPYRKMRLIRFHSLQNIALAVAFVVVYSGLYITNFVLRFVPFIGFLFLFLDLSVGIFFAAGWLVALIKASQGEFFKLPVVGSLAAKLADI